MVSRCRTKVVNQLKVPSCRSMAFGEGGAAYLVGGKSWSFSGPLWSSPFVMDFLLLTCSVVKAATEEDIHTLAFCYP